MEAYPKKSGAIWKTGTYDTKIVFSTRPLIEGGIFMIHFIKAKLIERKLRIIEKGLAYCITVEEKMLNLCLTDYEELLYDYYNEVLLCPLYGKNVKKEVLDKVRFITNGLNLYRFNNAF